MDDDTLAPPPPNAAELLESLLQIGVSLSVVQDRRRMLDMILAESRRLARAEAGSLYVVEGDHLRFVAAQNDKVDVQRITRIFLDKEIPISRESLVGFVAVTGDVLNIPDADAIPDDAPFRINRKFDAETGYRAESLLVTPLKRPDGECIGVLELINHVADGGRPAPFPPVERIGILPLASMAAVTIHNALLQEQLKQAYLDTVYRLSVVVEYRDNTTGDHIHRISHTSAIIAADLGLDAKQVELIECASPMHDIGKVCIPDAILLKPGRLTPEEREIVERHTTIGAEILGRPQNPLIAVAREIALSHHERWDGTGYPNRLAGARIPLSGRIVGIADVFDAVISKRCYKDAFPLEKVLEIIRSDRGKHFDPDVTDAFFNTLDQTLKAYDMDPATAMVH